MRKLLIVAIASLFASWHAVASQQDQEIQTLLDRAIAAQGGEKALANLKAAQQAWASTLEFLNKNLQ